MSRLDSWARVAHTHGRLGHPTCRKGTGPGVIVIHDVPGPTLGAHARRERLH